MPAASASAGDADAVAALRDRLAGDEAGELLAAAAERIGAEVEPPTLRSVHERTGRSVSCVYEAVLIVDGTRVPSLLVAHADRRGFPDGALVLRQDATEVAVWRFPNDPYLPGLPSAIDPTRVRELLDRLGAAPGGVSLRTRAYRPTRRAVVEVALTGSADPGRVLYLKVLRGRRAERLAEVHRTLREQVPVPRVFGVAGSQGILALEALGGATLRQALVEGAPLPEPDELVELSARIAASGLVTRRDPRAFADASRHVPQLARLAPDLAATIERVAAAATVGEAPPVPVHGDLHDGQVLVQDGSISGLLDIDGAGSGAVAEDAGNLVAHVAAIGEVHPDRADEAEAYAARIARAYRPVVGPDVLARATAASWLALATGPYRSQEPDWQEATRRRIRRAAAELPAAS